MDMPLFSVLFNRAADLLRWRMRTQHMVSGGSNLDGKRHGVDFDVTSAPCVAEELDTLPVALVGAMASGASPAAFFALTPAPLSNSSFFTMSIYMCAPALTIAVYPSSAIFTSTSGAVRRALRRSGRAF